MDLFFTKGFSSDHLQVELNTEVRQESREECRVLQETLSVEPTSEKKHETVKSEDCKRKTLMVGGVTQINHQREKEK